MKAKLTQMAIVALPTAILLATVAGRGSPSAPRLSCRLNRVLRQGPVFLRVRQSCQRFVSGLESSRIQLEGSV